MTILGDYGAIERLRKSTWLGAGGNRYTILCIAFSKYAIEREESPQQAAQMLDELLKSAPADVVRIIPPMSPAACRIVLEAGKLDPESKQIVVNEETMMVPLHPEAFRLLTGNLFWELAAMTPGTLDALIEIENAHRPQPPATPPSACWPGGMRPQGV